MADTPSKPLTRSRTLWINALTLVASMAAVLAGQEWIKDQESTLAIVVGIQSLVNIGLRFVTKQPITPS